MTSVLHGDIILRMRHLVLQDKRKQIIKIISNGRRVRNNILVSIPTIVMSPVILLFLSLCLFVFRLDSNNLGDSGVKLLSVALRNPDCKIQKLWLGKNNISDSCAGDLASALSINRSLTFLDLSDNKLGDSGVKLLSEALRNPDCKIETLELYNNELTASCIEDFAFTLSTNRSLIDLNLSDNKLGDSGVKLLSAVLRNPDSKIQELHLRRVGLSDSCVKDLISLHSTNHSLTFLDLRSNSFTEQSFPALHHLILNCRSLEHIWLLGNQFSSNGKRLLKSLQDRRPGLDVVVDV
ncbi:NACHT, LRR and PYD domains-containing protein 3-like [Heterodontus francisci]|uniref:NACHT, LRR and PYD domains-containing protein 3-like n=1 Tax=Heterodontus francisci TaxID=7792 RepID=UPI00355BA75F